MRRGGSGDDIGQQVALQLHDLIFERQFALFQPLHFQLIEGRTFDKMVDLVIQIAMLGLQLRQPFFDVLDVFHLPSMPGQRSLIIPNNYHKRYYRCDECRWRRATGAGERA